MYIGLFFYPIRACFIFVCLKTIVRPYLVPNTINNSETDFGPAIPSYMK